MYLTREMVTNTILEIDEFKEKLGILFEEYDIDLDENTGRRNALLSSIQEKVLAKNLSNTFTGVLNDGAPGMPDIVIGEIQTELECKLTSGSGKKSRSYSLQTDYATIQNKKKLDYVYFVSDEKMEGYCVLYFKGLEPSDFYEPPESARGKAKMKKSVAMKKAKVIVGSVVNINDQRIENYTLRQKEVSKNNLEFISNHVEKIEDYLNKSKLDSFVKKIVKLNESYTNKIQKLESKKEMWRLKEDSFSFVFESLEDIKEEVLNGN